MNAATQQPCSIADTDASAARVLAGIGAAFGRRGPVTAGTIESDFSAWYRALIRIGQAVGAKDPTDPNSVEDAVRERLSPAAEPFSFYKCEKCGLLAARRFSEGLSGTRFQCRECGHVWTAKVLGPKENGRRVEMEWTEIDPLLKYDQTLEAFGIDGLTLYIVAEDEHGTELVHYEPMAAKRFPDGRALFAHVTLLHRGFREKRVYRVRVREGRDVDRSVLRIILDSSRDGDFVHHPAHYNSNPSGVEAIDVIEHMTFCIVSAAKYLWRHGLKPGADAVEDLRKAIWYLQREVERLSK